jgi:hypothetical protein
MDNELLTEDEIKRALEQYLEAEGYDVLSIAWGHSRGIDIEAEGPDGRMLLEVKGDAPTPQMQGNYFLGALGELLQRMDDPDATYGIVLPDNHRFRGLVERFPSEARRRLGLVWIFVSRTEIGYKIEPLHPPDASAS